ncbi:conserved hypothetical protein [Stenotrophomonas thermophila]|nr:conserved hypothetical protein [Stenotrophomonas maltophilia]
MVWPGGWIVWGPLQVRPCRLGRRLLVCAVLRTRQDRGWASCPTRPRHASGPCGSRPQPTHPPGHGQFPVAATAGRERRRSRAKATATATATAARCGSDPFLFSDTPDPRMAWIYCRHREIVGGGEGADGGTVHGMDAVDEPTRTYLRRVPPSAPSPPNQQKSGAAFEVAVAVA